MPKKMPEEMLYKRIDCYCRDLQEISHKKDETITKLNYIIEEFEKQLKLICEMYYDDKDTEEMQKWIDKIKGDKNGIVGKKKT